MRTRPTPARVSLRWSWRQREHFIADYSRLYMDAVSRSLRYTLRIDGEFTQKDFEVGNTLKFVAYDERVQ